MLLTQRRVVSALTFASVNSKDYLKMNGQKKIKESIDKANVKI